MSKARELADVIGTQDTTENVLQGRRNLIINGAMQVAQRGTSTTGNGMTADRWSADFYTAGQTHTTSISTASPTGFTNSLQIANGAVAQNSYFIYTKLEANSVRGLSASTGTLSFYIKSTEAFTCQAHFNYKGNGTDSNQSAYVPYSVTTSWNRVEIQFDFNDMDSVAYDASTGKLEVYIMISGAGNIPANATVNITGVQLELGSVATPFEHRSYGEELALCQRYYYKWEASGNYANFCSGSYTNTTNFRGTFQLPVTMRASPTGSISASSDFAVTSTVNRPCSSVDILVSNNQVLRIRGVTLSAATAGHGSSLCSNGTAVAWFAMDAEL